ncbi:uncharacterized protein GIQ15_04944 [Arthroderma uncinatum]|uniref:uncharacterized protein n=1 Tax=Arthroderma uncinatum TaxID=74035 RepID=UPI00144A7EAC|nr:uncharacterized protein GIQ15_04944 [Arthroderma uncinatum]KAF3482185.1 hypothetical protein GIQ15_04944 [Arthroderma uncinatum]
MDSSDQMEWEPTLPLQTLLPQQILTAQRERLLAITGRRIMGLTYPSTASSHRPTLTRRILERSSPRRQWNRILASVDASNGGTQKETDGDAVDLSLTLNMVSPPVTPRKRVIEEVDEPEQYEDRFSRPEAHTSAPNVIDSPNDISMEDVFTPPSATQTRPVIWPQADTQAVQEATFIMGSVGLRSPVSPRTENRPNWFELREQAEGGVVGGVTETSRSDVPLQVESPSHGAFDGKFLLPHIPGSWPLSPPSSPAAVPASLPVQPSALQEAQDAPPSPTSRARGFLMAGGVSHAGPGRRTVVPRPADVPMTSLEPESSLSETTGGLRSLCDLPNFVLDFWGKWVVQTRAKVVQTVKRRAVGVWTPQTSRASPRAVAHPRREVDTKRDKKLLGMSMEQRRAFRIQEKRIQRKKATVPVAQELRTPEVKPMPFAAPAPVQLAQRGQPLRQRSKLSKSSINKIKPPTPGQVIAPGRVTKQRKVRSARESSELRILRPGVLRDMSDKERIWRVQQMNLDFVTSSRPAQVLAPEPQETVSPVAPVTPVLRETSEPPPPPSASEPQISPGSCIKRPSSAVGTTPIDEPPRGESYDGYAQRPGEPSARRVHWHLASTPLGQPVVDIRVYDPSAPVRPTLRDGEDDSQQPARATIDDKSPEGPFIKPLSSKWDSRLAAEMALPDYRQVGTTISGDPLTRKDFATCYTPLAWLNDEVINAYLAIILDYARRASGSSGRHREPKYHAFNSFFYSSLRDRGYESVRRWASRAKIGGSALLGVEMVLIPIHNQAHWTLMVVKPKARTIEYFDSLGGASRAHVSRVKEWLQGELRDLFKEEEWRVLRTDSPQQDNGSDCGVFLLTTAKMAVLGLPLSYGARDIPTIRKRIVAEILNGGFEGDFDPKVEFPVRSRL